MTEKESQETKQSAECRAAIKAAVEKVGEYCSFGGMGVEGGKYTVKFAGATIEYPEEINQIAIDEALEDEDCIEKIAASEWTIEQSKELARDIETSDSSLVGKVSVDRVAASLAEKIVEQTRTEEET